MFEEGVVAVETRFPPASSKSLVEIICTSPLSLSTSRSLTSLKAFGKPSELAEIEGLL